MPLRVADIACLVVLLYASFGIGGNTPSPYVQRAGVVGEGLHLWYEVKIDPEDPARMIICGTKWDALANTPLGFVYFSADTGLTWRIALEDRSSAWVTEHSCAIGSHHRAYFVSNAATQTYSAANPVTGTARLFVSTDSGEHWAEKTKIGWTDYSTSAVSKISERLYTFFHAGMLTRDPGQEKGNALGLLVISPDGTRVAGPYFAPESGNSPYTGIYPSNALALPSGSVIALYYATRQSPTGSEIEIGTVHADQAPEPNLFQTAIAHQPSDRAGSCLNFDDGAMAYDEEHNRVIVVYQDGCASTSRIMLTTSEDEGKTWGEGVSLALPKDCSGRIYSPSLIVSDHSLGLLWEDKPFSARWLYAYVQDGASLAPPVVLSDEPGTGEVSNDALWTLISQPNQLGPVPNSSPDAVIGVDVQSMANALWRTEGIGATNGGILAVWSAGTKEGMRLHSALIGINGSPPHGGSLHTTELEDVTRDTVLIYGGEPDYAGQYYDQATRTLTICAAIRNRAESSLRVPVEIKLEGLGSSWGPVSVVNATNALSGPGASWDISTLLTGDRIPAGTKSNPFCMSFRFNTTPHKPAPGDVNLLTFTLKVFARHELEVNSSETKAQSRD
jgi:hypothetical protein